MRDDETLADHDDTEPQLGGHGGAPLPARYKVGEVLGRGGMGEVIAARDEQIGRSVAIKRLRNDDPELRARFLREAHVQGRLEHPAVVPVHELAYDEAKRPFFVMKHLTGVTLAEVLPRLAAQEPEVVAKFTTQRLLRAFAEVCLAIEFAHTRGIVHRDLKPANIMLGDFGEVYVLDWGIARISNDDDRPSFRDIDTIPGTETSAGSILGTPGYIPPEQIRGEADLDERADVYALGCILFEILALRPLQPRGQHGLTSALSGKFDARASVAAADRDVPPELDKVCVRATAFDKRERFASARELGDAVQRFLDGNRDLVLRKELARAELGTARAALTKRENPDQHRAAIRAAARAIALDPTERDAVELAGHLMLQPPKEVPPEVDQDLAKIDAADLQKSTRVGFGAALASALFFPLLFWMGFREVWYHAAGLAICAVVIVSTGVLSKTYGARVSGYISIVGNLALFSLLSWLLTPILLGAGPAILMVSLIVPYRILRRPWPIALCAALATLSPWWLQGFGMPSRVSIDGGNLILHTAAQSLHPAATFIGLALYIGMTIHMAGLFSRLVDDDRRETRRKMQIQTWQLRQLMPKPSTLPPI